MIIDMNNRKKILYMGPSFMNYESEIVEYLSKKYQVDYIDTDIVLKDVRLRYRKNNLIIRMIFRLIKFLREIYIEKQIKHQEREINPYGIIEKNEYDIIFIINGDGISNSFYKYVFCKNKKAKTLLYLWDDQDNLFKTEHIKFFDMVYSYNILDCRTYGYKYNSMFSQQDGINALRYDNKKIYDICIIGSANNERVDIIKKILSKYNDKYKIFLYLYSKDNYSDIKTYDTPLQFGEYMRILEQSRCVLELVRMHQKGPTTRVNDCLFSKTKVITNNKYAKYYPNINNVLVINDKCNIPEFFILKEYEECFYKGHLVEEWFFSMLTDIENR